MSLDLGSAHGKVVLDVSQLKKASKEGSVALKALGAVGAGVGIGIGLALTKAVGKILSAGPKIIQLGSDAQETASLIATSLGPATEGFARRIDEIATATNRGRYELAEGMATVIAMSKSMGFGEQEAADYAAGWAQIAVDLGSFFNVAEPQVLDDINSAMAGFSRPMRKYGVDVSETTLKQMALQRGIELTNGVLDRQTRAMLVQEAVMTQARDAMGDAERTSASFINQLRGLRSGFRDTAVELGGKLVPLATTFITAFRAIQPAIQNSLAGVVAIFRAFVNVGIAFVKSLAKAMGVDFDRLAENSGEWGKNIVIQLARGMAAAASAVIRVLNQIGQIIAGWLSPGSPPKLLPDLPEWGASAMTEYMKGWANGDFSVFDEIAGTIEGMIRSMGDEIPEEDVIPKILGSRAAIAEAIEMVRETGSVSAEAFNKIFDAAGVAHQAIEGYLGTLLEIEAANEDVARANEQLEEATDNLTQAQDRLKDIEELTAENSRRYASHLQGPLQSAVRRYSDALYQVERANKAVSAAQAEVVRLTEKHMAILAPLNAALKKVTDRQEAIRDEKELAEIREKLTDESLSDLDREELKLREREIQIRAQIRAAEDQRDTEVSAAEDRLKAAEKARDAALEAAEKQKKAALELAQAQIDAAQAQVEAAQMAVELAEERLNILEQEAERQRSLLDVQRENNDLISQQLDLLDQLAEDADEAGKKLKGAGDGIQDLVDDLGDLDTALGGSGVTLDIFEGKFDDIFDEIDGIFEPVTTQAEELGKTWGGVFTGMSDKVEELRGKIQPIIDDITAFWEEHIQPAIEGVQDVIGDLVSGEGVDLEGWLRNLPPEAQPLVDAIMDLADGVGELVDKIRDFIGDYGQKFRDWFVENRPLIEEFLGKVGIVFGTILTIVLRVIAYILKGWEIIRPYIEAVTDFTLGMAKALMQIATGDWAGAWETIKETAREVIGHLREMFKNWLEWLLGIFGIDLDELIAKAETFRDSLQEKWEEIKLKAEELWNQIRDTIKTKVAEFKADVEAKVEAIRAWIQEKWEAVHGKAVELWTAIKDFLFTTILGIHDEVTAKVEAVRAWIQEKWEAVKEKTEELWQNIKDAIIEPVKEFYDDVTEKVEEIRSTLEEKWDEIKGKVEEIWEDIREAIETKWEEIKTLVGEKIQEIIDTIEGFAQNFFNLGANIVGGIKSGILSAVGGLVEAAKNAVSSAFGGAQEEIDSHSPSRKFTQLGQDAGRGMIIGLENMVNELYAAGQMIGKAAFSGASGGVDDRLAQAAYNLSRAAALRPATTTTVTNIRQPAQKVINYNIYPQYAKPQSERTLRDDIRLLQLTHNV